MKEKEQTVKILICLTFLLVTGFTLTSWISYHVSHQTLRQQIIDNELPLTSDNIYSEIQRDLLPPVFIASLMANNAFLRTWVITGEKETGSITQFLSETQRKYNTFTSFFVSERTRLYYQSKGILKTVSDDNAQDSWYFRVRQMASDHEINVDPDQANQYAMTIFVNNKVFDFDGNYIGATGVGLKVGDVKQIIQNYHKKFNRIVNFVSPEGKIILSTESLEGKNIRDLPGLADVAPQILGGRSARQEYRIGHKTFYVNSRYIPEFNWILLVSKSDEAALRILFHSLLLNLALCSLVTLIVIILVYLSVQSYRRKLKQMFQVEMELQSRNDAQQGEIDAQQGEIDAQHRQLLEQNTRLTQINASKDKLFSIIAHDLRSPLGNLVQLATLSSESLAAGRADEATEYLVDQREQALSALQLLDHLFDWAKSQLSEITCVAADFCLRACLEECLAGFMPQVHEKKLALAWDCPADLRVHASRSMVMTVVRNLVSNAIKFTPSGGSIGLVVTAEANLVMLAIRDSGVGIAPERMETLFDFVHNKSTRGTQGETGSGLGLSLCRELIRKNGGEITVESAPGGGSVFRFTLPQATAVRGA